MKKNIIDKIIIYSYLKDSPEYTKQNFLSDVTLSMHTITRQFPYYILNKKKEVIAVKTTLMKSNLNLFLYKFKKFTLIKFYSTSVFYKNIFSFDVNFNLTLTLTNKSYFFEYFNYSTINYNYKFNIKLLFNKDIDNKLKIDYILNTLKLKLIN